MSSPLQTAIAHIDELGAISDSPDYLVRTFLSPANKQAAAKILEWMTALGMETTQAPDGTVRGVLPGENPHNPPLLLGSHYDTVIDAGKYDGALGIIASLVMLAFGLWWLNREEASARARGEGFGFDGFHSGGDFGFNSRHSFSLFSFNCV